MGADNRVEDSSGSIGFLCREPLDGEPAGRGLGARSRGRAWRTRGIHAATLMMAAWAALTLFAWLGTSTADARVLVSNMDQSGSGDYWCLDKPWVAGQRFTTGANALGYDLNSIELELEPPSEDWNDMSVNLRKGTLADSGQVVKLNNPTGSGQAVRHFRVPSNTEVTLDPNTNYFVRISSTVVEETDGDCLGRLRRTGSNNEDSGGLSGWSIKDAVDRSGNNGNSYLDPETDDYHGKNDSVKIRVNGSVRANTKISSIAIVSNPAEGDTYRHGEIIRVAVHFSREVVLSGNVQLTLWMGGWRGASYHGGSGTSRLEFRYVVQPGDSDSNGIKIGANALAASAQLSMGVQGGGSIVTEGTTVAVNLAKGEVADDSDHKVDGRAYIKDTSISSSPAQGDTYRHGETIEATVEFDRPLAVTGAPQATLWIGGSWRNAGYHGGSGTNVLVFRYVVKSADSDSDGVGFRTNTLARNGRLSEGVQGGAIVTFGTTVAVDLRSGSEGAGSGHKVDGRAYITDISISSRAVGGNIYRRHETIELTVEFSRPVTLTGDAGLALTFGLGVGREAPYHSGSGTRTLVFRYVVKSSDSASNGIGYAANALALAGGGTLKDEDGVAVNLTSQGTAGQFAHRVDGSRTTVGLSALSVSAGTLSPGFAANVHSYAAMVGNGVGTITVTATPIDDDAAVAYLDENGAALTDADTGATGQQVALSAGANTIKVQVTAAGSSSTTLTYTLVVTRAPSTDAALSALSMSAPGHVVAWARPFAASVTGYTATVDNAVETVTVTATPNDDEAAVAYLDENGAVLTDADTGVTGQQVALSVGANTIKVRVTATDGLTTRTYTVVVTRAPSTDATLSALSVSAGTLSPAFAASVTGYTATVGNGVESVTVTATRNHDDAAVTYLDENDSVLADADAGTPGQQVALSVGANTIKVRVTAQDQSTTQTYTVVLTRPPSTDATLSALGVSAGTLSPAFTASVTGYTATVGNAVETVTVTATRNHDDAAVAYLDENDSVLADADAGTPGQQVALSVGANTIKVRVTAQDQSTTQTYTVVLTRPPSTDATLSALGVSAGTLSPAFTASVTGYTATVGNAVETVTVTATRNHDDAAAAYLDENDSVLADADAGTPGQQVALSVGANTIKVRVTAQDQSTTETYTVVVTRRRSTDATLSGLGVSAGTLSPAFTANVTGYTATVGNGVESVTVTATRNHDDAAVAYLDEDAAVLADADAGTPGQQVVLSVGANTVKVRVTAPDGSTTRTYTLVVTRAPAAASTDARLRGLSLSPGTLSPAFGASVTDYAATVGHDVETVTVTPATNHAAATVTYRDGNNAALADADSGTPDQEVALSVGANTIHVGVAAEDGTTRRTYTVVVTRLPSTDATLRGLSLSHGTLSPAFTANVTGYAATVGYGVTAVTVTPATNHAAATVTYRDGSNAVLADADPGTPDQEVALSVGANTIHVGVTAEDGTTRQTYTVVVTRAVASTDARLSGLSLSHGTLSSAFAANVTGYTAMVGHGVEIFTVTPATAGADATVAYLDENDAALTDADAGTPGLQAALSVGANTIKVQVTAGDGTTRQTYTLVVTRAAPSGVTDATLSALSLSAATLSPAFAADVTGYTAAVGHGVETLTVMAATAAADATVAYLDGNDATLPDADAGTTGLQAALSVGANTIKVRVTAGDGTTRQTYTLVVTRAAPPVAADGNGDGVVDGDDALVMYYAYQFESLLGRGGTGGFAELRRRLLAGLANAADPTDEDLRRMLRNAHALR